MTVLCYQMRPGSLGTAYARSADPDDPPAVHLDFLSNGIGRRTTIDAVEETPSRRFPAPVPAWAGLAR